MKTPKLFADAVATLTEDQIAESIICGPDPKPYVEKVDAFRKAGFDHIYFHQVGLDQDGFFQFWRKKLMPALGDKTPMRSKAPHRTKRTVTPLQRRRAS